MEVLIGALHAHIAGQLAVEALLTLTFFFLYARENFAYLRSWALGYAFYGVSHSALLADTLLPQSFWLTAGHLLLIPAAYMFLRGTLELLGQEMPRWVLWALASITGWTVLAPVVNASFLVATIPALGFVGLSLIGAGAAIIRSQTARIGRVVAGGALILQGVHHLDYPILRTVAEFAPWGFQIATYLHVCIGVGFLIVFYERVQHDLSDSEQQYRSMFENAIEGIFRVSPDGDFRAANPALLDMLGYPSAAELTRLDTVEDLWVNPDDRAVLQADRERAQQGVEVEWRRRDGQPIKVLLRGYEVTDSHGNLLHYEGSVRDITAEKVMENQLAVSRKLDALGRLAGGVAHDFNNMLTAILMSVDFAERAAEHNESPVQDLEIIRTAGERASDLTQKLLAFSRKRVTPPELIDLNQAVANACAMLDRLLTDDIDLRVDTTDQALPIETAPGHLEQIVLNLATNAEQAMPDGGELSIRTCLIDADTPMAQLVVRDTGVGMDEETQLKLFDPFYSTRQPEEGTGLGLTTVFGIVHQLDGDIELESHRGEGTEFRIVLPLSADEPQKEEETTELDASEVSLADKTILVVDDEAVVRRVITRALESAGCQLIVATNGAQAIELGRRHIDELDLIISDMVMPGKSGPEVVEALHEIAPDLPYLFVSGYAEETLEERGLEPHEWLSKPVSFSRLLLRVDELLSRHDTSGIR